MRCHDGKIWYTNIGKTMILFSYEEWLRQNETIQNQPEEQLRQLYQRYKEYIIKLSYDYVMVIGEEL